VSLIDHIPSPAEIAARRARMGVPVSRNLVAIPAKPVNPSKPPVKAAPKTQAIHEAARIMAGIPGFTKSPLGECPMLSEIKRLVSFVHRIPLTEILSEGRHPALVKARDHIVWLACRHTYKSLPQIGEALGKRDHTTVLHSLYKTVKERGIACRGHTPESIANRVQRRRDYMRDYERVRDRSGRYQRADLP
jgi:hypothetical protein